MLEDNDNYEWSFEEFLDCVRYALERHGSGNQSIDLGDAQVVWEDQLQGPWEYAESLITHKRN